MIDPETLKFDSNGLIPAIVQDAETLKVLMLGYMNAESIKLTHQSGNVTFYSRSRNEIWEKGATSGNYLKFESMHRDCDNDALLVVARPEGPACHTGNTSCFYQDGETPETSAVFLEKLEALLQGRKKEMPEGSYTTSLFKKGIDKIAQKVGEEAVETVIASKNQNDDEFIYEASDLIFHLLVLCTEKGIPLEKLIEELKGRHKG